MQTHVFLIHDLVQQAVQTLQATPPPNPFGGTDPTGGGATNVINTVVQALNWLLGAIGVLVIAIAALKIGVSGGLAGNPRAIGEAFDGIKYYVGAVVLALLGLNILNWLIGNIHGGGGGGGG